MHVLQYKNMYVQCFPCEMQTARALSFQVTYDDCNAVWAICAEIRMEEVILTFTITSTGPFDCIPPHVRHFRCVSIVIYIYKHSLTQLSFRQLLKCIFNHVSQLHVLARPSGAIFTVNFFKKVTCTIDNAIFFYVHGTVYR